MLKTYHLFMFMLSLSAASIGFVGSVKAAPHLLIDLDNGKVLSHQQAFDPWHPASLTKLMTAFVAFRAIQSGEITSNHPVRVSKQARRQPPSRMGYRVGTTLTMENALKILVVKSANDIAVAIGESISGSVENFAHRMNQEAARLGMKDSRFVNPHGLHDKRQVITARDLALLIRAIHTEFPQYANLFRSSSILAPSRTKKGKLIKRIYYSYNLLLERFRGGDGFKTGFVCASGYNFIGSATRSGRRIAAIVLGRDSQTSRAVDAAELITKGFRQPMGSGSSLDQLTVNGPVPSGPRNMRGILCTKEARAKRYEPGAGLAVIKSPWLQTRIAGKHPLNVVLEKSTKASRRLKRIPLPTFRPAYTPPTVATVVDTAPVNVSPVAVAAQTPLPTFRPQIP